MRNEVISLAFATLVQQPQDCLQFMCFPPEYLSRLFILEELEARGIQHLYQDVFQLLSHPIALVDLAINARGAMVIGAQVALHPNIKDFVHIAVSMLKCNRF